MWIYTATRFRPWSHAKLSNLIADKNNTAWNVPGQSKLTARLKTNLKFNRIAGPRVPRLEKNSHALSERLASLAFQVWALLKPFNTIVLWWSEGFPQLGHIWLPRDVSISNRCTSDCCCFTSLFLVLSQSSHTYSTQFCSKCDSFLPL